MTPAIGVPCDIWTTLLPEEAWLVPGFIDLQVNGGGDGFGTTGFLSTRSPTPE
ncbi:MAG: hypothetical protein J2P48_24810 [Alphaproteobacteria bacterium]|nr:hypothetical protein [Alphaproteobacteria bacterium]